ASGIPGMIGLEAGQSAFGDTYAWFRSVLLWPYNAMLRKSSVIDAATTEALQRELSERMIPVLSEEAAKLPLTVNDELAIDWLNGRRTPDADQSLKGALSGLSLGTGAPHIFKALVEATCFGARAIVERFVDEGVPV